MSVGSYILKRPTNREGIDSQMLVFLVVIAVIIAVYRDGLKAIASKILDRERKKQDPDLLQERFFCLFCLLH